MWPSPNGTIRDILGGTIFRQPIIFAKMFLELYLTGINQLLLQDMLLEINIRLLIPLLTKPGILKNDF